MDDQKLIIAIDGYSSCGKSTLAKALAARFEYAYVDSGAMYRAVTLYLMRAGIDVTDVAAIIKALENIQIEFRYSKEKQRSETYLNGENVEEAIRDMSVSSKVSEVSKIKEVRKALVKYQRDMGKAGGIVMDGRDIGTVVFPKADLKLFMTADLDVRAQRRYQELLSKGQQVSLQEIMQNLVDRDRIDTTRAESPLRKADDAREIDNTHLTPQQQLDLAGLYVKQKLSGEED